MKIECSYDDARAVHISSLEPGQLFRFRNGHFDDHPHMKVFDDERDDDSELLFVDLVTGEVFFGGADNDHDEPRDELVIPLGDHEVSIE